MGLIGQLGALASLLESGVLADVREWWGCSAGSICAVLGIIGVSPAWIRDCVRVFEATSVIRISEDLLTDYTEHWGVNNGDDLTRILGRFIDTWEPGASQWTFADMARERPGCTLGITALNVSKQRYEVFSAETTPAVRIVDAVRASSSIPLLFVPWRGPDGSLYCDGGVIENFPWRVITDKSNTLVVLCSDRSVRRGVTRPVVSLSAYLAQIFGSMRMAIGDPPRHWIAVNNREVGFLDFGIDVDTRLRAMAEGDAAARGWVAFMRDAAARKPGTPLAPVHQSGLPSCHPASPVQTSDNPSRRTPQPSPCCHPHPRTSEPRRSRRWSL